MTTTKGSIWFQKIVKDCAKISTKIRFKRIKYGFYRVYWGNSYLHEVYAEMPQFGYDKLEDDVHFQESKKYYEEYEDSAKLTRMIKNYVEGYWDSLDRIKTRAYMLKNDDEFAANAAKAYAQFTVK